ncbi:hypothetical protein [Granulicella tundricola]|uniref:Uncharacterized protein n=1 Tax=Granulicella tundricola (strain ATCC BAA-1859 / DSM 23138 / MP5ACTX9) TaxID=1198114 RepID=E8X181_GRATM|nr:hypothetical protein [Granulicella tundricola]ADW69035.1 hypothetical protein AciX9_1989 [Granulicella tundricola MP5ACTX9]
MNEAITLATRSFAEAIIQSHYAGVKRAEEFRMASLQHEDQQRKRYKADILKQINYLSQA